MSDLVERLRRGADDASLDCYAMCEEAADRIEALEAALREIAHGEDLEHETIGIALEHARSTAQAALASEPSGD